MTDDDIDEDELDKAIRELEAILATPPTPREILHRAKWDQLEAEARDDPEVKQRLIDAGFDMDYRPDDEDDDEPTDTDDE